MCKNFDFDNVGKRMPYTTPEGFFDNLKDSILSRADAETVTKKRRPRLRIIISSIAATAAAVAVVLMIGINTQQPATPSINDVDLAFSQLSTDDQEFMLNVYQNDVFINQ